MKAAPSRKRRKKIEINLWGDKVATDKQVGRAKGRAKSPTLVRIAVREEGTMGAYERSSLTGCSGRGNKKKGGLWANLRSFKTLL